MLAGVVLILAALAGCGTTMATAPRPCTADRAFKIDTAYYENPHRIGAIAYECK